MNAVRLRTLEAMALLVAARGLIRFVPMGRWQRLLGKRPSGGPAPAPAGVVNESPCEIPPAERDAVRACVAAVRRASWRMPASICLPQAIALQWMLSRRGIASAINIGILPSSRRGTADDLHAWVICDGSIVLGDSGGVHATVLQFQKNFSSRNCKRGTIC